MSNSLWPHGLLHPWDFPGKSTGVGCHFLLQGIFPTQGLNLGLLHYGQTLYSLSHQVSCRKLNFTIINLKRTRVFAGAETTTSFKSVMCTTRGPVIWELSEQSMVLRACTLNPSVVTVLVLWLPSIFQKERRLKPIQRHLLYSSVIPSFKKCLFSGAYWVSDKSNSPQTEALAEGMEAREQTDSLFWL